MGKDSKHQRTKGGVQPSSSSRTAELLQKSGGGALSFMAASAEAQMEFGGTHSQAIPAASTILTTLLLDDDLPSEIRMVFRKLQKKDAVTKIKALTELTQILGAPGNSNTNSNSPSPSPSRDSSVERPLRKPDELEELSKSILPHWCKAYQKLTVDDSRKVRESVHLTHTQICKNVGRNLAPFLKHLVPSWYLAQFDLYSPVSSASKRAFQNVFTTEKKKVEVIKFCKNEILRTIVEHLQGAFRTSLGTGGEQQTFHKEKRKQQGKKKGQSQEPVPEGPVAIAEVGQEPTTVATSSEPSSSDGEPYAMRVAYECLQALVNLIEQDLAEKDVLDEVFGEQGLIWSGAEIYKDILIRRSIYDLLTTLTCSLERVKQSSSSMATPVEEPFQIPSLKCAKLINSALSANQKETLPNLWNTFLILTLNGVLSDIQLARKQLLTCCKNGFYGNATQIGPSVLPLLARIWQGFQGDGGAKEEFSHDLIAATIQGYGVERSLFEKAAIARTLAETFGFLCKNGVVNMQPMYQFIFTNVSDLSADFARLFGMLIKDEVFYTGLVWYGGETASLNSKDFGVFVVGICTVSQTSSSNRPSSTKRSVKFLEPEVESKCKANVPAHLFEDLSVPKQLFLQSLTKTCLEKHAYKPLSVVSRHYQSEKMWEGINASDIDLSTEEDKLTRLQLALDLIQVHPENPSILSKFSDEFENFQEPSDFKIFLKELDEFINLQPVKRWVRMSVFTDVIENLLREGNMLESELQSILKFILRDIFPSEFTSKIVALIKNRLETNPAFFDNLAHILASTGFKIDLSEVYEYYWDLYFRRSVSLVESDLELIETVCFRNLNKLNPTIIGQILEKYLESCEKAKQIDILIEIMKRLDFPADMIEPLPKFNVKPDVLSFIGESFLEVIHDNLDLVPKFSKLHRAAISKAIFKGKLAQDSEFHLDLINPLLNVIYAQSVATVWAEVEKSGYFDHLNQELVDELVVVSSRLTEKIYENKAAWKTLWEEVNTLMETHADPLWRSGVPMRVLLEYCSNAELRTGVSGLGMSEPPTTPEVQEDFKKQIDDVLKGLSKNIVNVKDVIPWLSEKRVKQSDDFEFECLFRHIKNKPLVHKLLIVTLELMNRSELNDEITQEFLSLGACWIAAWLKQTKNLNPNSKTQLLWISNLARGVELIGRKARNLDEVCSNFLQEYVEFHSSQIYPIIYSLYIQLNQEVSNHSFWTMQTLYYVSAALTTIPSNTLAFIEPDSAKMCEIFGHIVGNGVSLPTRIAAYRILRKVKYDLSGEGDMPIVPPAINNVIKQLIKKVYGPVEERADPLISYLLIWDALLKIQQGSNEFATYVRDQDHLLTPFLNTLFFSESISLEDATAKFFEKESDLVPGCRVSLLHLSCTVVQRALRNLPYTVRWWWNNQVTKQRDRVFVEKFIVKYLSSKLAAEELGSVKLREGVDDNVTIHCHSGCNELIAHYRIEETNVTLTVSLPLNHPLGPVTVKISDKKLHGKISHLLNTRSHSLSAGLKLWKENLDGLYKDVDECAICFFILHNVTKQIPKLGCKTCKKKFHAACLYKWFSTSNKSECPLCRNLF